MGIIITILVIAAIIFIVSKANKSNTINSSSNSSNTYTNNSRTSNNTDTKGSSSSKLITYTDNEKIAKEIINKYGKYTDHEIVNGIDVYYIGDKVIGLSPRKGYGKCGIVGVHFRNLPITQVGKFNGFALAETENKFDDYAIAIYNDAKVHLGYLPKNNKELHSYILDNGGKVHAYGYMGCGCNGSMYGEVCVEINKDEVTNRNKPYKTE